MGMNIYRPFNSIYSHGFIRVAVAIPTVRVADCNYNAERTLHLARRASKNHAAIVLFPELGISAYTNEDLFHQDALLDDAQSAIASIKTQSHDILSIIAVGAPLRLEGKLFNCAVVIYKGKVLGIVPKTYIPNYREFYEKRQFSSAWHAVKREVSFLGETVQFGNELIFEVANVPGFSIYVEICEDLSDVPLQC